MDLTNVKQEKKEVNATDANTNIMKRIMAAQHRVEFDKKEGTLTLGEWILWCEIRPTVAYQNETYAKSYAEYLRNKNTKGPEEESKMD